MKKKLKVSYVLPVHNEEVDISNCIKSILAMKGQKELIVINDASTDHTGEVLATFGKKIKIVTNKTRLGAAKSRNIGNKMTTGDIIAVCDVDLYLPLRHEAIIAYFTENEDMDVFYSSARCYSAANPNNTWEHPILDWDFASKCVISHPTMAFRREVALAFPYHEETVESDLFEFMLIDMYREGKTFGGVEEVLMLKREQATVRDKTAANLIKADKYKDYGIDVMSEQFVGV